MSAIAADTFETPALAGAIPLTPALSAAERRRRAREHVLRGLSMDVYDKPIWVQRSMFGTFVLVNEPAGVKHFLVDQVANYPKSPMERRFFTALFGAGLLGTDGDVWRRHRRIMAPSFDPRSVAAYGPAISKSCEDYLARWEKLADGEVIDIAVDMSGVTLLIIARSMFSTDTEEVIDTVSGVMKDGFDFNDFNLLDVLPVIGGIRMKRRIARMEQMFRPLDAAIDRMIADRAGQPDGVGADLLGRLVAATDAEPGGANAARMTPQEVRDQVITIFMAGHETTAQAMSWTWYLLDKHPEVEARLHAELDAVLGGRTAVQEDLPRLVYTKRVIEESMRLYPPAPGISARVALADDEICGVKIRKGDNVSASPWVLHRHRKLWDDPERFDPDRFAPERSHGRHRFAYMPFGGGPRVCIGQVLAMNEAILILANLAQKYAPRLVEGHPVTPRQNVTLRPQHGLKMRMVRRAALPQAGAEPHVGREALTR